LVHGVRIRGRRLFCKKERRERNKGEINLITNEGVRLREKETCHAVN